MLVVCGILQTCPFIAVVLIALVEIFGTYGLMSLGGNVSGRGT